MLAAGCTPPASNGGQTTVTSDERIDEVRAARASLAEPVPALIGEASRLVAALEEVWTREAAADVRAELAGALRLEPFREAADDLEAVELEGEGPDVEAATAIVEAMVADAHTLLEVADDELASLQDVEPFDQELDEVVSGWNQRGSYSQQLEAFDELAVQAEALADDAAERTATPACVELWPRREQAAEVVAERTRELHGLIRDRRGQEFDELRDEYGQDPYGLDDLLGVTDAQAAAACWGEESEAHGMVESLQERVDELAQALDPDDLRG